MPSPSSRELFTERTPRVVAAVKLHRSAARRAAERFLVEGAQAVREAIATTAVIEVFATEAALTRNAELWAAARAAGVTISTITDRAAVALSETVTPQGLVAVCPLLDTGWSQLLTPRPRTVAVLVDASEPGNAGTVIRVADAAGADAVVLAGDSVDVHNGKCVRASAGSVFHLPIARRRDVSDLVGWLRSAGLQVIATAAHGEVDLDSAEEILSAPTAWLFGNEAHGLDPTLAAQADHRVRVPIHGRAESLNLAAAAAVCLYAGARAHHLGS